MRDYTEIRRFPRQFTLGKHYTIWYSPFGKPRVCKLIQPTKCGFNFLDLDTNKCVLKQHLYPSKCKGHESGNWFWVNVQLITREF